MTWGIWASNLDPCELGYWNSYSPPIVCSNPGMPKAPKDLSGPAGVSDCYVDVYDLNVMAEQWLNCTMPDEAGCDVVDTVHYIVSGSVTVDGDISDWPGDITWHDLDQMYSGSPNDVTNAQFALLWNEGTDKVYAAVTVTDMDHIFETNPWNWNSSDRLEIYMQGDAQR